VDPVDTDPDPEHWFQAWQERLHTAERSRQDELMYLKQNKVRRYNNVYMFFLAQHLSSLKDVKPTQRMQLAREEWNRLSEAQKAEYESKFREHLVEFKAGICGIRIRIQEGKNDPQRRFFLNFRF
jgi:hypothetical protein